MKKCNYESHDEELELPVFEFSTLVKATDNFAMKNKLGEGGFGLVYKVTNLIPEQFINVMTCN